MWRWLCKHHTKHQSIAVDPDAGNRELDAAQRTLDKAQRNQQRRAPVFEEAERHIARNGIYDDLVRSLRLKGSGT